MLLKQCNHFKHKLWVHSILLSGLNRVDLLKRAPGLHHIKNTADLGVLAVWHAHDKFSHTCLHVFIWGVIWDICHLTVIRLSNTWTRAPSHCLQTHTHTYTHFPHHLLQLPSSVVQWHFSPITQIADLRACSFGGVGRSYVRDIKVKTVSTFVHELSFEHTPGRIYSYNCVGIKTLWFDLRSVWVQVLFQHIVFLSILWATVIIFRNLQILLNCNKPHLRYLLNKNKSKLIIE